MSSPGATLRFGEALRERRLALGLSQVQVCDLAGVGAASLRELEHGKATVRLAKLLAVLEVLGLGLELQEGRESLSIATQSVEQDR